MSIQLKEERSDLFNLAYDEAVTGNIEAVKIYGNYASIYQLNGINQYHVGWNFELGDVLKWNEISIEEVICKKGECLNLIKYIREVQS